MQCNVFSFSLTLLHLHSRIINYARDVCYYSPPSLSRPYCGLKLVHMHPQLMIINGDSRERSLLHIGKSYGLKIPVSYQLILS